MAIASLVCDHLESTNPALTLKELDSLLAHQAFPHYREWGRQSLAASACSHRFDARRFNRESWKALPELGSVYKASVVKGLIYWAAAFLQEQADQSLDGNAGLRAYCAFYLAQFQRMVDTRPAWLNKEDALAIERYVNSFLLAYQKLAGLTLKRPDHRRNYKITPKFHSFMHMGEYSARTQRNVRCLGFHGRIFVFLVSSKPLTQKAVSHVSSCQNKRSKPFCPDPGLSTHIPMRI